MKEIVIKVSDELLSFVYRNGFVPSEKRNELNHAILQCVELPKGHGELIDEKDLSLMTVHLIDGVFICDAPSIIEADKESENDV